MAVDVKLLKAALEEAKFEDVELREKIYECINELDADLDDVEYKPTVKVETVFDELEKILEDMEEQEEVEEEEGDPTVEDEQEEESEEDEDDDEDDDDDDDIDDDEEDEDLLDEVFKK